MPGYARLLTLYEELMLLCLWFIFIFLILVLFLLFYLLGSLDYLHYYFERLCYILLLFLLGLLYVCILLLYVFEFLDLLCRTYSCYLGNYLQRGSPLQVASCFGSSGWRSTVFCWVYSYIPVLFLVPCSLVGRASGSPWIWILLLSFCRHVADFDRTNS